MKLRSLFSISVALILAASTSCSSTGPRDPQAGTVYSQNSVEQVKVLSRTNERVKATTGRVGGLAGSIGGSLAGGLIGSVVGGLAGPLLERTATKKSASRYTLERSNGTVVTIYQIDDKNPVAVGSMGWLSKNPETGQTRLHVDPPV